MATARAESDTLLCCACSGPTDPETGRCVSQLYPACQGGKVSIVYKFTEAEIEAAMAADPDFPEISADDLRNAVAVSATGRVKRPLSIRLDEEVLEYYRSLGPRYQTRINNDLLALVREKKRACRASASS
jgi:uncharacterized protein (DUF4415 family)